MAAAKETAKKGHPAVPNLKRIVEEGRKTLANLLEEKALHVYTCCVSASCMTVTDLSRSIERDHELKDAVIKLIIDAQQGQKEVGERGVIQSSTSKPTASAIYQSAKSNLASSREVLGHYERATQKVAIGKGSLMMDPGSEKDSQTLQRILHEKGEKIKLEVHQLLNKDPNSFQEQAKCHMSESDTDLWHQFAVLENKAENVKAFHTKEGRSWAVVAKNAQQGVRRTVRHLPEYGE